MAPARQERRRIVVDGSNIATEGRTTPSLAQLDEAIRSFLDEYQGFSTNDVTVVVDASFGHRIDPSELAAFEQALDHGEMITPPAGAVGRGDGFILRIAEKSGALVLSNDSFQEFHAERPWLFEPGRLIGGKPVPGVGWVFTPRTPVRGARSRATTTRSKRAAELEAADKNGAGAVDAKTATPAKKKVNKAAKTAPPLKATKTKGKQTAASEGGPADEGADGAARRNKPEKVSGSSVKAAKTAKLATAAKPAGSGKAARTAKSDGTGAGPSAAASVNGRANGGRAGGPTSGDGKPAKSQPAKSQPAKGEPAKGEPAKGGKAAKAARGGKSTAAEPDGKAAKPAEGRKGQTVEAKSANAGKATKSAKGAKTTKAATAVKAGKAGKAGKAAEVSKAGKAVKAGKAAKRVKEVAGAPAGASTTGTEATTVLNDPVTFLNFVANHPVGSTVEGTVVSFTSHGAHIDVDGMICHVPLRGLGDPPPSRARQVLSKGENRHFILVSLDAARRRAALALPGLGSL